jgi:hypothetical protein
VRGLCIIAFSLVFLIAGCRASSDKTVEEPNLEETLAWMHSFSAAEGAGSTFDGTDCSASITWLDSNGSPTYVFRFSFKDLDPNSAKSVQTVVSPPGLQNMWRATAVTTNNLKKVAVYNYSSKLQVQDNVIEGIPFYRSEDAERFAKALRHAIVVCGGKPSPF